MRSRCRSRGQHAKLVCRHRFKLQVAVNILFNAKLAWRCLKLREIGMSLFEVVGRGQHTIEYEVECTVI